jgi:hypothetical protein
MVFHGVDPRTEVDDHDVQRLLFQVGGLVDSLRTAHRELAEAVVKLEKDRGEDIEGLCNQIKDEQAKTAAAERECRRALQALDKAKAAGKARRAK